MSGRLLPADQGQAAQFMYEDPAGQRLTLYVRRAQARNHAAGFRYMASDGLASFYWIDGPLGYALTADLDRQQLLETAQQIYHPLSL